MILLKIIIKCVIVYFLVLLILKFMGKREIGQLSLFDFAVILIMADIMIIGIDSEDEPFYYYLIPIIILSFIQKLFAFLLLKIPKLRNFVDGKESIIIFKGELNISEMKKQNYNMDDLLVQLRAKGISSLSEVEYAILETSGHMSVFKKEDHPKIPFPIIMSGILIEENIQLLSLDKKWIKNQLNGKKIEDILYANYENETLYFIPYMEKQNKIKKNK